VIYGSIAEHRLCLYPMSLPFFEPESAPDAIEARNYRKTAVIAASFFSFCLGAAQSPPKCSGSDCLVVTNIRHGTRCGTPDSFEADIQNVSSLYLRGYVYIDTPEGPWKLPTGLMQPGQKGNVYHCHASGKPGVQANTGADKDHLPYPGGNGTTPARFSRPNITGVRLDKASIDLLKTESEKLRVAGATKNILAWSPLIELIGENNEVHAAFSISQTNWEELAKSFSAVDKTIFYSLATDARNFANSGATWGNPQLKQFWNAMADFYASQAPER